MQPFVKRLDHVSGLSSSLYPRNCKLPILYNMKALSSSASHSSSFPHVIYHSEGKGFDFASLSSLRGCFANELRLSYRVRSLGMIRNGSVTRDHSDRTPKEPASLL